MVVVPNFMGPEQQGGYQPPVTGEVDLLRNLSARGMFGGGRRAVPSQQAMPGQARQEVPSLNLADLLRRLSAPGMFGGGQPAERGMPAFGPMGAWGYTPEAQSPYAQAAATQASGGVDRSLIEAQALRERNPWEALQQMIAGYPDVYGSAVQGTTAMNLQQMQNELQMNKLSQILPFLKQMGMGVSTNYGAGIS